MRLKGGCPAYWTKAATVSSYDAGGNLTKFQFRKDVQNEGETGVNYTHTFTYAYRAGEGYDVLSIDGVASQVSEGSFAAADSEATWDKLGRRIAMNYDVANGSTKKEEFSFNGDGQEIYVYGRAKNSIRPSIHYTYAGGELHGKNYEDGGILFKWNGDVYRKGEMAGMSGLARGLARKADFTETYQVDQQKNGKIKSKTLHYSEQASMGVRYTRGLTGYQAGGSSYTVVSGDTLRGIAQKVYGHEGLWYLIADANGLNSDSDLTAGLQLGIPETRVTSNDSSTFKPYSPNALPIPQLEYKPPSTNWFAMAISVVVAALIVIYGGPAIADKLVGHFAAPLFASGQFVAGALATAASYTAGYGLAGGLASVASQGINIAGGNQDGFDLGQVGIGAISGGLTFGATEYLKGFGWAYDAADKAFTAPGLLASGGAGAASGMVANQLITGHSGFRWSNLVAGSVSSLVSGRTAVPGDGMQDGFVKDFSRRLLGAGSAEATRQAMGDGGHFNATAAAVDAFGNALANKIAWFINQPPKVKATAGVPAPELPPEVAARIQANLDRALAASIDKTVGPIEREMASAGVASVQRVAQAWDINALIAQDAALARLAGAKPRLQSITSAGSAYADDTSTTRPGVRIVVPDGLPAMPGPIILGDGSTRPTVTISDAEMKRVMQEWERKGTPLGVAPRPTGHALGPRDVLDLVGEKLFGAAPSALFAVVSEAPNVQYDQTSHRLAVGVRALAQSHPSLADAAIAGTLIDTGATTSAEWATGRWRHGAALTADLFEMTLGGSEIVMAGYATAETDWFVRYSAATEGRALLGPFANRLVSALTGPMVAPFLDGATEYRASIQRGESDSVLEWRTQVAVAGGAPKAFASGAAALKWGPDAGRLLLAGSRFMGLGLAAAPETLGLSIVGAVAVGLVTDYMLETTVLEPVKAANPNLFKPSTWEVQSYGIPLFAPKLPTVTIPPANVTDLSP